MAVKQLTVKDVYEACKKEIANGNGDKLVVISDDPEGNAYHGLFYDFTKVKKTEKEDYPIYDSLETDPTKVMILG